MARGPVHPHIITDDSALGGSFIQNSLRFNDNDSAYITRSVSSTGNRRTWTVSFWMKFCEVTGATNQRFWSNESGDGNGDIFKIEFYGGSDTTRRIGFIDNNHAGSGVRFTTNRSFRDPSAWYHIVLAVDTTQSTATNRVKIYVNNEQISDWLSGSEHNHPPNQNYETCVNLSGESNTWGRSFSFGSSSANYFDGYLAEMHFIDGTQLTPESFGYTDFQTKLWRPKRFDKSSIPNRKGRTFSGTWTASGNGFGSAPVTRAYAGNLSSYANNNAGGQILTWNTSTFNLSGRLRIYCYSSSGLYDIYVNGNTTKVADTSGSAAWVDCGTFNQINEIQFAGTSYNTNNGLGSAGIYFSGFMIDGTLLRDDMNEFGTNGYYLNFSDNSAATATTIGKDRSGNGNDFTPNNFSVSAGEANDSSLDTPSANFVTLNPLRRFTHNCTLSNGNLKATGPNQSYPGVAANISLSSGKWYYEFQINTKTSNPMCGVCKNDYVSGGAGRILYRADGRYVMHDGSEPSDPDSYAVGNIIGVAIDLDDAAGKIRFYKNGTLQTVNSNLNSLKSQLSISTLGGLLPYIQMYHNDVCTVNFGQRPFNYTPPDGFKSLSTNNFFTQQTPHIISPKKHFDTLTYTGNAGTDHDITGLQFKPDLVWIKSRSQGSSNHGIVDSVRLDSGSRPMLYPNLTNAETVAGNYMDVGGGSTPFLHNGIRVNNNTSGNNNGSTYVAWCWKAGGETSSSNPFAIDGKTYATAAAAGLDGGTANPTGASVNTKAGFSIVSYTATNNQNVSYSHGLNQAPEIIIAKDRDNTRNWGVYYTVAGTNTNWMRLNTVDAQGSNNSSVTPVGGVSNTFMHLHQDYFAPSYNAFANGGNDGNDKMVAYMWHSVPGYSKIGVYEGNQSANGPYIHLGFRPAFIIIKNIDNGSNRQWCIIDATRTTFNNPSSAKVLFANDNTTESVANNNYGQFASKPAVDILSDGFKVREGETSAYTQINRSNTHIYMAFAEQPGSTAYGTETNAR